MVAEEVDRAKADDKEGAEEGGKAEGFVRREWMVRSGGCMDGGLWSWEKTGIRWLMM